MTHKRIRQYFSYKVVDDKIERDESTFHAFDGNLIKTYTTNETGEATQRHIQTIKPHTTLTNIFIRSAHPEYGHGQCHVRTEPTEPGKKVNEFTFFIADGITDFVRDIKKRQGMPLRITLEDDDYYASL